MSTVTAVPAPRFVRRTSLKESEYHRNFRKLDSETISLLTSNEASKITSQMCKVYLSLINVQPEHMEREGVIRFTGCEKEGEWQTAWEQLVSFLGVASATARKALIWMNKKGIIGYYAGRNGVGIRVFLNRAASSIGQREHPAQKNLRLIPASFSKPHTSPDDTPFKDSYADLEASDTDLNPHAPKYGADDTEVDKNLSRPETFQTTPWQHDTVRAGRESPAATEGNSPVVISVDEIVTRLQSMVEPALKTVAARTARHEHERTREWLDKYGIPKATRVAQREAYNVLRRHGVIEAVRVGGRAELEVGRAATGNGGDNGHSSFRPPEARPLSPAEITEAASTCVALFMTQGKAIVETLREIGAEAGGWVLADDVPKVREAARTLMPARGSG